MENLVESLAAQREELLARYVATSDREEQQKTVQQLKALSEELELAAAASSAPHSEVLSADFYASYLLVVLLARNLNDARFLWKRVDVETKNESELQAVWEIGKALWQRNLAGAYAAMDRDWSPSLQGLIAALRTATRESTAELLSKAYATISVADAALALGFSRHEDAYQYCASLNWEVSAADELIMPKPLANVRGASVVDLDQLDTLSKSVLHLEQNTVLKLP